MTPLLLALIVDRTVPPPVSPPPLLELPAPERFALSDALTVELVRVVGVRMVEIDVRFHHGSIALAGGPTEAARALGWLADAAAGDYDATELSTLRDLHEIELWTAIDHQWADVRLTVPAEELAKGLELLGAVVKEPDFPRSELSLYKRDLHLFYEVDGPSSPDALARAALAYGWFSSDSPFGRRPNLDALDDVSRNDLRALHERWLATAPATILVVGDVDRAAVETGLRAALLGSGATAPKPEPLPQPAPATRTVAVDLADQEQASLRLRFPFPDRNHSDHAAATVLKWALGGNFMSRLNLNLREQRGYTYGAGCAWVDAPGRSFLTISVDVPSDVVAETVFEINKELSLLMASGLTEQERDDAALAAVQDFNATQETASTAFARYQTLIRDEQDVATARRDVESLASVTLEETTRVAATWFGDTEHRLWVLVGDKKTTEAEMGELPAIEWVAPDRTMLGDF